MFSLMLYVTEHCHLCDLAFNVLADAPELAGHSLQVVDISVLGDVDDKLLDQLGPQIPWVSRLAPPDFLAAAREQWPMPPSAALVWPFTGDELAAWISGAQPKVVSQEG